MWHTPARSALVALGAATALVLGAGAPALAQGGSDGLNDQRLAPRTQFTMQPDGSSGATEGGEGIPNIDSVKKTIATYYGDPGTGLANKASSPYIAEMGAITASLSTDLKKKYNQAIKQGKKPAIVLDADDTTLWTYDMEVADMHFNFDPVEQNVWVQERRFPATPGMVNLVNEANSIGYTIIGLTGRSADQKAATVLNLKDVGYEGFTDDLYFTKWAAGDQPAYITCATAKCTTVEYKAGTRRHLVQDLGYDIVLNIGDQWSDLMGGYADRAVKLPNPTYYLPSPNLPGQNDPTMHPQTRFSMKPDGSSGLTAGGEGIPNIDIVKKTLATYYGDAGDGFSNKQLSPYISELGRLEQQVMQPLLNECRQASRRGTNPAVVFDADDTTLWTYDMEVSDMHYNFDPARQDVWVQNEAFSATPGMVSLVNRLGDAGCTIVGLTGRNSLQKSATLENLANLGYQGFTSSLYFTKWLSNEPQPSYVHCATAKCTTVEYKSQTRKHLEQDLGYHIVANFGDQYSDHLGGYTGRVVKLPNPTYYLP
ncbi:MAG: HAD family acid phosphatase [Intrasporangium sp.]|uniref:HAD family acid phosphatase n=1 Tax=Intrasporangium sp. TaxID=1925024 RepID=UPI003F7FA201